ncbi:MAG: FHA domain-containing protein [Deltaproteobacteria bacterium]|jgi:pSer/pThr/pTyr-binding forkhead associated (FHA) protein|nr:FHA domain-containing protein [Deltaproteobacteria bacterium]
MALLKVKKNGKYIHQIELDPALTYTAGRKEGVEILLGAEKAVSREHFSLKYSDDYWHLEVLSKFGDVIYQNEKVKNISFSEDTIFFIPPYEFEFYKNRSVGLPSATENPPSPETENQNDEFEKTVVGKIETIPQIQFVNEDLHLQKTISLTHLKEWTAGRDPNCEILIDDQRVSRKQFKIKSLHSEFFLVDLGSVNGTILNNKNIVPNEEVKLRSGDKIQVLDTTMLFELKNSNFDKGLMALQPIPLEELNSQEPHVPSLYEPQNLPNLNSSFPPPMSSHYMDPNLAYQLNDPLNNQAQLNSQIQEEDDESLKKKKIRMVLIGVVFLVLAAVFYTEVLAPPTSTKPNRSNDPFAKMNPNELSLLKQRKEIANDYYFKKSFRLALDETQKILKRFEELEINFKKTKFGQEVEELDKKSALAIEAEKEIIEYNTKQEEQRKNEEKLTQIADQCATKLKSNPSMTMSEYDNCIASVIYLNPAHPKIQSAKLKIQQAEEEKLRKMAENKVYRENVSKLKWIYKKAVKTEQEGNFLQAIEDYKAVLKQNLPDPEGLKKESNSKIISIEKMISMKSISFVQEAEKLASEKKYKEAIQRLKAALKVNPIDMTLDQKITLFKRELAKEIKPIWEEATIEETYSQVECTENKSCAIEKWKKIILMDVQDGEYYIKAFTKLKKYGAH